MIVLIQFAGLAIVAVLLANALGIKDLRGLMANLTRLAGYGLGAMSLGLLLMGRVAPAIGMALFAASLLGWDMRRVILDAIIGKGPNPHPGGPVWRTSRIVLAHDLAAGRLHGEVLAGRFKGRTLADLTFGEFRQMLDDFADDSPSLGLAEAYLDSRMPGWREHLKRDPAAGQAGAARSGRMSEQEAQEILGLQPGAGEAEIREAYRRLMKAVHPDAGGSAYLAGRVNEARDRLVGKHGTRST